MGDDRPGDDAPPVFVRGDRVALEDDRTGTVLEVWYAASAGPTPDGGSTGAPSPDGEPGWLFAVWIDVPGGNPVTGELKNRVVVCREADLSALQGGG